MEPSTREPSWMDALRTRARKRFQDMPWPTTAEEEWRRTDVSRLGLDGYAPRAPLPARGAKPAEVDRGASAGVIRFESGACTGAGLDPDLAAKGVRLLPLEAALEEFEAPLHSLYEQALEEADNRFLAWHYGEWSHGALLWIPEGLEIAAPFIVDFQESGDGTMSAPHLAVLLGTGARATVVHRLGTQQGSRSTGVLCNTVVDARLGDAAGLELWEHQELAPADMVVRHTRAAVSRDASLRHFDAELGARFSKARVDCSMDGPGAEAFLDGAYYCGKGQHMDLRTVQRHRSPRAMSRAVYKGAVDAGGRTVYQGLIEVSPGASGTDAWLTNRNLILGEGARSDSIPTLKIGNNDVKCSHGSTTGKLNPEELFYLQTRGYDPADAREMLVIGYFEDLLTRAPEVFREETLGVIRHRLKAA
ncbi:MAG TPA: SufD family Fe-S cluster assembly protein [Spirochaetia bacterium]|nr:SufD family Fe-S cluster assembly protein [Spirochaetia bacterium]